MKHSTSATIYALSSGGPPAGVAVIRVSGPGAFECCDLLTGKRPSPRVATLATVRDSAGSKIDDALVLTFKAPHSFTGEDVVEFQVHGGRAVIDAMLRALANCSGLRHAEAGEFSRRAFENGKLDLVEIEGLADLIAAETEMQRRLAHDQSSGKTSAVYNDWAHRLTQARAFIEAELDFADEDDVPGSVSERVWSDMSALADEMEAVVAGSHAAEIVRDGLRVAIVGAPNAGKSTLLNVLARRDVAIVTNIPGTTRDVLQVDLNLGGYLVRLYDTAGLRDTSDVIELEGIRRALVAAQSADLILYLRSMEDVDLTEVNIDSNAKLLKVGTKADLSIARADTGFYDIVISSATGQGLDMMEKMILAELEALAPSALGMVPGRQRQLSQLKLGAEYIRLAADSADGLDIRSEFLRVAGQSLGKITGRVDVEDLLDVIFSEFCIGK